MAAKKTSTEPIVSSSHLVGEQTAELSEFEFGLIIANNAFQRWIVHCMSACGMKDLNPTDILILHNVNHRNRSKRLADVCFTLNIEDTHTVSYALRKLAKLGLVVGDKSGKEMFYSTTKKGHELCEAYRQVRVKCLTRVLGTTGQEIGELAKFLRTMSGFYDQAARAAASL